MAELNDLNQWPSTSLTWPKKPPTWPSASACSACSGPRSAGASSPRRLHTGEAGFEDALSGVKSEVIRRVEELDGLVDEALAFVESNIEPLGEQLPQPAVDLAHRALSGAREVQTQVRNLVGSAS